LLGIKIISKISLRTLRETRGGDFAKKRVSELRLGDWVRFEVDNLIIQQFNKNQRFFYSIIQILRDEPLNP